MFKIIEGAAALGPRPPTKPPPPAGSVLNVFLPM